MSVPRIVVRQPTLEKPVRRTPMKRPSSRAQWIFDSWDGLILDDLCGGDEGSSHARQIRDALFQHGYAHATACLVLAVLLNHVRRVLVPWLGGFLDLEIVAGMKAARSVPHYFVQQSLGFEWQRLLSWLGLSYLLHLAREPLAEVAGTPTPSSSSSSSAAKWRVAWLVMLLAGAEHAYAHACWTAAQLYAQWRLVLRGGEQEQKFLQRLLEANPIRATVLLGLVVWGLHHYLVPMATKIPRGRWVVGVVYGVLAAGTARVVRYSGYYFIALEVSDMLATFAWLGVVLVVVGVEALRETLGVTRGQVYGGGASLAR